MRVANGGHRFHDDAMDFQTYGAFVPATYTADMTPPASTWWPWRVVPAAKVRAMGIHGGG
jgi:hypothetical protein